MDIVEALRSGEAGHELAAADEIERLREALEDTNPTKAFDSAVLMVFNAACSRVTRDMREYGQGAATGSPWYDLAIAIMDCWPEQCVPDDT